MWNIDQNDAGARQLGGEVLERVRWLESFTGELLGYDRIFVVSDDLVTFLHCETREIGSYASQSHDPESHVCLPKAHDPLGLSCAK